MNILLVDDQELVRDTVANLIRRETSFTVDGARNLQVAVAMIENRGHYDLVLIECALPGMARLEGMSTILSLKRTGAVALFSANVSPSLIFKALELGALGYIPKTIDTGTLVQAIRMMGRGERFLPPDLASQREVPHQESVAVRLSTREKSVLSHICQGMTNAEIGSTLGVQEATVKSYIKSICTKVAARNRTHASIIPIYSGLY